VQTGCWCDEKFVLGFVFMREHFILKPFCRPVDDYLMYTLNILVTVHCAK